MRIWTLSNTGVRNSLRLQDGFRAYAQSPLVGRLHGRENEMALDALIRGYGRCVDGADLAQEYEITDEMEGLKAQILQQLSDHFGVSEEKAAELHAMTKRTDYTKAIQEILAAAGLE